MKKLLFTSIMILASALGGFAQVRPSNYYHPTIFKYMNKPTHKIVMAKINDAVSKNGAHNKKAVKLPELIYTQLWDSGSKTWGDTSEKYVIAWDHNKNLQSITNYTNDIASGSSTRAIETDFMKSGPIDVDDNVALNFYPGTVTNQDLTAGKWENTEKELVSFNKNGVMTAIIVQQWAAGSWADYVKLAFIYDTRGSLTQYDIYTSDGKNWTMVQSIKETFTFNTSGFATEMLQTVSAGGSSYDNNLKEVFTIDSKGAITSALVYTYDVDNAAWVKYDSFANMSWLKFDPLIKLDPQTMSTTGVLGIGGEKYLGYTETKYDSATKSWSLAEKHIYNYNADSLITNIIIQNENNKAWENSTSDSTTYYAGGNNIKTYLSRYWSSGWHNTSNGSNNQNIYDADNDITESIVQHTDPFDGNKYNNYSKTVYKYKDLSGIAEAPAVSDIKMYPNPVVNHLCIALGNGPATGCTLSVCDITGKTIKQQVVEKGETDAIIDVNGLQSGMYFLTMNNGTVLSTYKFIKN